MKSRNSWRNLETDSEKPKAGEVLPQTQTSVSMVERSTLGAFTKEKIQKINALQTVKYAKDKVKEIQLSSNKNNYEKIFSKKFKTDHSLIILSDKKIFKELMQMKGLRFTNIVIEGVVPFNYKGENLLKKEIQLYKKLR